MALLPQQSATFHHHWLRRTRLTPPQATFYFGCRRLQYLTTSPRITEASREHR